MNECKKPLAWTIPEGCLFSGGMHFCMCCNCGLLCMSSVTSGHIPMVLEPNISHRQVFLLCDCLCCSDIKHSPQVLSLLCHSLLSRRYSTAFPLAPACFPGASCSPKTRHLSVSVQPSALGRLAALLGLSFSHSLYHKRAAYLNGKSIP